MICHNVTYHNMLKEADKKIEEKVLDILTTKMDLPISRYEIDRTHRLCHFTGTKIYIEQRK